MTTPIERLVLEAIEQYGPMDTAALHRALPSYSHAQISDALERLIADQRLAASHLQTLPPRTLYRLPTPPVGQANSLRSR